jgi:hypothetical protein
MKKMNNARAWALLAALLLLGGLQAKAQWQGDQVVLEEGAALPLPADTLRPSIRSFSPQALDALRADERYRYDRTPPPQVDTFMARLKRWLARHLFALFYDREASTWLNWFLYSAGTALIFYFGMKLIGVEPRSVFYRRAARRAAKPSWTAEDLRDRDFNAEIGAAEQAGQFAEALRLHYLHVLSDLAAAELIAWTIDKTNMEYTAELRDPSLQKAFGHITFLFERVYYGHFPLTQARYREQAEQMRHFLKMIIPD